MGLGDRIRAFFSKRANPSLGHLEAFVRERRGVEGFIEPRTSTQPLTLLLVDRDGDSVRAAVRQVEDATAFCERIGIPVYDAAVIGYPRRMQERGRGADDIDARFAEIEKHIKEGD
jgi:hypothetical protein